MIPGMPMDEWVDVRGISIGIGGARIALEVEEDCCVCCCCPKADADVASEVAASDTLVVEGWEGSRWPVVVVEG